MELKLSHIRLLVSDYKACFRFYRDMMQFEIGYGEEEGQYADFLTDSCAIALYGRDNMAQAIGNEATELGQGKDRVSLIFGVANVDEACAEFKSRGARFVTEPHNEPDWGVRVAHFRDPDGNLIEINQDL